MEIGQDVFIAPNATVIGNVSLANQSSVWFGAVIRGDSDAVSIGIRTNIQDLAVIHVDPGCPVDIGDDVTVGHAAIVHGASVGEGSLIGMRATLLNNAKVGRHCLIGAHSLVTEGMEVPDYSVVMGTPGKVVKTLSPDQAAKLHENAAHYVELGAKYLAESQLTGMN